MIYKEKQIKQVFLLQFHDELFKSSKLEGVRWKHLNLKSFNTYVNTIKVS
jgi:hypothetical protein